MARVEALECSLWQQVCCNQVYCHPTALNTSPQVQGENKPGFLFPGVPVTPWHRSGRGWRVSGLEQPECGAAAGPAQGSGVCQQLEGAALIRVWKCLGKKIYCRNTKLQVGNRVIMLNPFVLFHPVPWHRNGGSPSSSSETNLPIHTQDLDHHRTTESINYCINEFQPKPTWNHWNHWWIIDLLLKHLQPTANLTCSKETA